MADPLVLLRDYTLRGLAVNVQGDNIVFGGEYEAQKSAGTNYRKATGGFYSLEAIFFLCKNANLPHSKYIVKAKNEGIPAVTLVDRKDLLSYLKGEKERPRNIDESQFVQPAVRLTQGKHAAQDALASDQAKKHKADAGEGAKAAEVGKTSVGAEAGKDSGSADVGMNEAGGLGDKPEVNLTSVVLERERLMRDRNTVLQVQSGIAVDEDRGDKTSRTFFGTTIEKAGRKSFSNVLSMLNNVKKKDDFVKPKQNAESKNSAKKQKPDSHQLYNRYEVKEKDFWQDKFGKDDVDEFQIDTMGTNLERAPEITETVEPKQETRSETNPIIIVPSTATSIITIYNVKDLLEDGKFIPSAEKKKQSGSKPKMVTVKPKKNVGTALKGAECDVYDNTAKFSKADWARVIGVFVQGPAWQFKGWPWKSPVDVLVAVKGFYLTYEDGEIDKNVKAWNVNILKINKNRRYLDGPIALKFWNQLDHFVASKKNK
eukprot:Nk52_evm3s332 gene=Nk52_evmTU3s332